MTQILAASSGPSTDMLITAIDAVRRPGCEHIGSILARTLGRTAALSPETRPVPGWVVSSLAVQGVPGALLGLLRVTEPDASPIARRP